MILGARDAFGCQRRFYRTDDGAVADSVRALVRGGETPDTDAIRGFLAGPRLPGHTVLREIRAIPPGHVLLRAGSGTRLRRLPALSRRADLRVCLETALAHALQSGKRPALALSGGLDSALLLALLQRLGAHHVPAYILVTDLPDYCERHAALAMARRLAAPVVLVHAGAPDFVAALPRAIAHVEEPLFNLHPVAKLLLAEAMARDGIGLAITGDGADQVVRRDQSANYLPLCKALSDAAGVTLSAPFLAPGVVRHLTALPPDPDKQALRALGATLGLPAPLVQGPKRSRLAPAMDLTPLRQQDRLPALAHALGLPPPRPDCDVDIVSWTTLALTLAHLGVVTGHD